jgi:hypothetical protein
MPNKVKGGKWLVYSQVTVMINMWGSIAQHRFQQTWGFGILHDHKFSTLLHAERTLLDLMTLMPRAFT